MANDGHEGREDLYVSRTCYVQTAESRFGKDVLDEIETFVFELPHVSNVIVEDDVGSESEDEEEDTEMYDVETSSDLGEETDSNHAQHGFPKIATTRNNLTALSQRYNLYFAAYQDRIYVYQPQRTGPRILPAPSLILHPPRSPLGTSCPGAIDTYFPHQINHIIVGNLGNMEIVLFAYDDGDVAAYYTYAIAHCIKANSDAGRSPGSRSRQAAHPKLCFQDNVGSSAWGLAIHEQSRLIAVGSNLRMVVVFAFALSRPSAAAVKFSTDGKKPDEIELEKHVRSRTRTWRIVLPLGYEGHNIPNVTFMDDEAGEADKVVAIDIRGNVWLLDIWNVGQAPVRWPKAVSRGRRTPAVVGWGVLVLPDRCFKRTQTVRECLGVPGNEVIAVTKLEQTGPALSQNNTVWLDTTCSLYYIRELSLPAEAVFRRRQNTAEYAVTHACKSVFVEQDLSDSWETDSDSEDGAVNLPSAPDPFHNKAVPSGSKTGTEKQGRKVLPPSTTDCPWYLKSGDTTDGAQMLGVINPTSKNVASIDSLAGDGMYHKKLGSYSLRQTRDGSQIEFSKADLPEHAVKDYCLLRTSLTDIELQPFNKDAPCIDCKYVLPHHTNAPSTPWDLHPTYSERVSMLIHIPQLNLVAAGSPTGRVALITLTKTAKRLHMTKLRHGFRVDYVLPRRSEDDRKLRPGCTLIGIAMSPVPYRPGVDLELRPRGERPSPTMYRLILHYKDHTILMYDIARSGDDGSLTVF
ncbi:uncharacterized protein B0T15DRAFT_388146 [Chaetomium strumarium]|uniref:Pyridine nucleotide-disulfide oxidoreductase family protein n=1 Tax=Chaetomium strumarium TaxID=1170767 RepID=A0AAJ0H148_9PEZI|nr:hypothetical protein B0T15DRAFT_388146 [Chaetomium strumarium]